VTRKIRVAVSDGVTSGGFIGRGGCMAHTSIMPGANVLSVEELLERSCITTTLIYTHVAQEHLRNEAEKLSY